MAALFAALVVPWFINWNDFRASFEAQATQILGHPVTVNGTADASILPAPSLTFTDVIVGDPDGERMAEVERFDVTIELMPLLQGEIRVTSMRLVGPVVTVRAMADGQIDWLERGPASQTLDADKIVLESVKIENGTLTYDDQRSGIRQTFAGIRADISARSLSGPWRVDNASTVVDGSRYQFSLATGRVLDDGSIRIKADIQPLQWPIDITVDGNIANKPFAGLTYQGTYNLRQVGVGAGTGDQGTGWRSEGAFQLAGTELKVDRAILSTGPPDRPLSLAGSLSVQLAEPPTFSAFIEANQIDLDRTLGSGPAEPIEVATVMELMRDVIGSMPVPPVDGNVELRVPVIVVGGSIIQNFFLNAAISPRGIQVAELRAGLPGQANVSLSGFVGSDQRFGGDVGFDGRIALSVLQPATFAAWWRGPSVDLQESGRLLSSFDLAAEAEISPGRVDLNRLRARIGSSQITGEFDWGIQPDGRRILGSDLSADRIDYVQLQALAQLLAGRDLSDVNFLADDYHIRLAADEFATQDVVVREVVVDAAYTGDVLNVNQISIGDFGGTKIRVTAGQIKDLTSSSPVGELDGNLEAKSLDGLVVLINRLFPGSALANWLSVAAPELATAHVNLRVTAPPEPGGRGVRIALDERKPNNAVGLTVLNKLEVDLSFDGGDWRDNDVRFEVDLTPLDPAVFLKQLGIAGAGNADLIGSLLGAPGSVVARGRGVPADGMAVELLVDLAGVSATGKGKVTVSAADGPSFTGRLDIISQDIDPAVALLGLAVPGAVAGSPLALKGADVDFSLSRVAAIWQNAELADRRVGGDLVWKPDPELGWRLEGALSVGEVDLDWLMALGLGFAPRPTGDSEQMWSRTPFSSPGHGAIPAKLAVEADRFYLDDNLYVANAQFDVVLAPQRIDLALRAGEIRGGTAKGSLTIHNVGGNARIAGQFQIAQADLGAFMWRRGSRPIATGTLGLTANFEATGQSPSGLVSSLTGGGVIEIAGGEARYINPNAARPIIRESDVGQEFDEASLKQAFLGILDADSLVFGAVTGPFDVAAGTLRLKNLTLKAEDAAVPGKGFVARGDAVLDFNTMTTESDWTLTFVPNDNKVEETDPRVGMIFRGPIAAPERSLEVVPFLSYLNLRLAARELEILELEEADRLEKDRLRRLLRKFKQDAARRERERLAAEEAERVRAAAQHRTLAALDVLHLDRWQRARDMWAGGVGIAADRAVAAAIDARVAADAAAGQASAARAAASEAAIVLAAAIEAAETATTSEASALAEERRLDGVHQAAMSELDDARAAADRSAAVLSESTGAEIAARELHDQTSLELRRLVIVVEDARSMADTIRGEVERARIRAQRATEILQTAESVHEQATADQTRAELQVAEAEVALQDAVGALEAATLSVATPDASASEAAGRLAAAEAALVSARDQAAVDLGILENAAAQEEAARARLETAEADATANEAAVPAALAIVEQMTAAENATDVDRRLAADLEARVRLRAEDARAAATEAAAGLEEAKAQAVAAAMAQAASRERLAERQQTEAEAVTALALAQHSQESAAVSREQAGARLDVARQVRGDATATLTATRAVMAEAEQSTTIAAADMDTKADFLVGLVGELGREETVLATAVAQHTGAVETGAAALATLQQVDAELAAARTAHAAAADRLQMAEAASSASLSALAGQRSANQQSAGIASTAIAARATADSAWRARVSAADLAEVAALGTEAKAGELEAAAERARALAGRVAVPGWSPADEPATYPDAVEFPAVNDERGDGSDQAFGVVDQEPTSDPATPPIPKLRPDRDAIQLFFDPVPDAPVVITPTVVVPQP